MLIGCSFIGEVVAIVVHTDGFCERSDIVVRIESSVLKVRISFFCLCCQLIKLHSWFI